MSELVVCGLPYGSQVTDPVTGEPRPITDFELIEACGELKKLGVTAVQIYVYWNKMEPNARGEFDWSYYDSQVEILKKAGMKWVPFFLMGPRYAAPEWWLESEGHRGMYCLEHGKYNPVESIWSPAFLEEIDRVMAAFAAHYLPMDVIESFQPGISGDYGETQFSDIGNWPGHYHSHRGFWCGGEDAKASFRAWLKEKFGTVEAVNEAWRSRYVSLDTAEPFLPHQAPSRTAWYDFLDWYRGSMTAYTIDWLKICRKNFPETPIYMCVGGMEQPELGTQFAEIIRACAEYNCGIRLTNEGNKFYDNYLWTALAKSACDQYGAYLGLEPVGPIIPSGVTNRVFGSAAFANRQMFNYYGNLMGSDNKPSKGGENFKKYIPLMQEAPAQPGIAMFWPGLFSSFFASNPENLNDCTSTGIPVAVGGALSFLRRQVNTVPMNERLILDGGLSRFKLLVNPLGVFTRREVLVAIADWVKEGGVLVTYGIPKDLEMQDVPEFLEACGLKPDYEYAIGHHEEYYEENVPYARFAAHAELHSTAGIIGVEDDVKVYTASRKHVWGAAVTESVIGCCEHEYGKGRVIIWTGKVTFEDDPNAIFPDHGWFRDLLTDVIEKYSAVPSLAPAEGEVARAIIGGKCMALTEDAEIIEV